MQEKHKTNFQVLRCYRSRRQAHGTTRKRLLLVAVPTTLMLETDGGTSEKCDPHGARKFTQIHSVLPGSEKRR